MKNSWSQKFTGKISKAKNFNKEIPGPKNAQEKILKAKYSHQKKKKKKC